MASHQRRNSAQKGTPPSGVPSGHRKLFSFVKQDDLLPVDVTSLAASPTNGGRPQQQHARNVSFAEGALATASDGSAMEQASENGGGGGGDGRKGAAALRLPGVSSYEANGGPHGLSNPTPRSTSQTPRTPGTARGAAGHRRLFSKNTLGNFQKANNMKVLEGATHEGHRLGKHVKPNPQYSEQMPSANTIRVVIVLNMMFAIIYLYWRATSTITTITANFFGCRALPVRGWAWVFYISEIQLTIAIWIGHFQRMFPVQRIRVNMDDLVREDDSVGYNARPAVLLPTAGEGLDVVLKALLGVVSQRGWHSGLSKSKTYKVLILDEKRRKGVLNMMAASYALATMVQHPNIITILQAEGVSNINAKYFYDWWKDQGGYARKHLYNDHYLNQACRLLEYVEEATNFESDGHQQVFSLENLPEHIRVEQEATKRSKATTMASVQAMLTAMNLGTNVKIEPGFLHQISSNPNLPTMIYYTRRDSGTPAVSPKAGNMNSVLFPVDYPDQPAIIGDSTIVIVNDARHQLLPDFLQRTCPYLFELDEVSQRYKWAKIAYVQTPQRFPMLAGLEDDPLGNSAAIHYDVVNHGKDGIGAVSSSGQGSVWRKEALMGVAADGTRYANVNDKALVGHKLGFRAEMLVEDTHTSIDMFRHGWRSVYVNESDEHLSVCTHQPNSIQWRIKQVLRWHQGAVQLLFYKGPWFTSIGGKFPTVWHRIFGFDQCTYYLQAFPGMILLLMPIIYGIGGHAPFDTKVGTFFVFFTPYIVTAMLPNVISASWRNVDADRLTRDEQVWLSTCFVQLYAFISMSWSHLKCEGNKSAWSISAPTWPLFACFIGEFMALVGGLIWLSREGFGTWAANFISVCISAALCIHALWPMVSCQLGWKLPSAYYLKVMGWLFFGVFVILISFLG